MLFHPIDYLDNLKIRVNIDQKALLLANHNNLIDKNYLELFSDGINSSYFYYFLTQNTIEKNYFINSYAKTKIKGNLVILSSVFMEKSKKVLSFRLKNEFGTTHLNVKVKKINL